MLAGYECSNTSLRKIPYRPKLCGNCAFPQNFHTMKLGEITVFYAVPEKKFTAYRHLKIPQYMIIFVTTSGSGNS